MNHPNLQRRLRIQQQQQNSKSSLSIRMVHQPSTSLMMLPNHSLIRYNAQMTSRQVREHCELNASCQSMLRHSVEEMGLSARAHDKILRVARTIADVAGESDINEIHLAEAIGYRNLDRDLWV